MFKSKSRDFTPSDSRSKLLTNSNPSWKLYHRGSFNENSGNSITSKPLNDLTVAEIINS